MCTDATLAREVCLDNITTVFLQEAYVTPSALHLVQLYMMYSLYQYCNNNSFCTFSVHNYLFCFSPENVGGGE